MDSTSAAPQDCDRELCHHHGSCAMAEGQPTCRCLLGYTGAFCQDRVSESIRVPLTLGFLGVIAGMILLAFTCRFLWKRVKMYQRKIAATPQMIPMVDIDK